MIAREEKIHKDEIMSYIRTMLPPGEEFFSLEYLNKLILSNKIPPGSYKLEDIGNLCGLSRERIRQIESSAMKKLKLILSKPQFRKTRDYLEEHISHINHDQQTTSDIESMMSEIRTALRRTNGY